MTYKENITAILECFFGGFKQEIIDNACNCILELEPCEYAPFTIDELKNEDMQKLLRGFKNHRAIVTDQDCSPSVIIKVPCEDAISRKAVLDYIHRIFNQGIGKKKSFEYIQKYVEKLPPVNPTKTGWHIAHGMYNDRFWCSCGFIKVMDSSMYEWKYCPVCGKTKIVVPQESEVEK